MFYVSVCALSAVQTVLNSDLQGRDGELYCTVDKMGQFCNRSRPQTVLSLSVVVGLLLDHLRPVAVYQIFLFTDSTHYEASLKHKVLLG